MIALASRGRTAAGLGALGLATTLAAVIALGGGAWRAWLAAASLCCAVPAGAAGLAMMAVLIPGPWRQIQPTLLTLVRRLLPVGAVMIAPLLAIPALAYGWTGHAGEGVFRQAYLSPPGFLLRGAAWLALLAAVGRGLAGSRAQAWAIGGLLVYTPMSMLIAFDWWLSLDPHFTSSGFGLYALGLQMNLALALAVAACAGRVEPRVRQALGAALLASLALWAYLAFMPYFIVWSGDLPAGVVWYRSREGGWAGLIAAASALKLLPGVLLALRSARAKPWALSVCALCIALGAVPEGAWLVLPAPGPAAKPVDLLVFAAAVTFAGLAGLGLWARDPGRRGRP